MKRIKADLDKIDFDYDMVKDEVLKLLGQDPRTREFDYVALVKRVSLILVTVYGIGKFRIIRQLAFSIASSYLTRWLAEKAIHEIEGKPKSALVRIS